MSTNQILLSEIEAFLERHKMAPTVFGVAAVSDGHLVRKLKSGRGITTNKMDRIRDFIRDYKPGGQRSRGRCRAVSAAA